MMLKPMIKTLLIVLAATQANATDVTCYRSQVELELAQQDQKKLLFLI
jgi:hypothetical protein